MNRFVSVAVFAGLLGLAGCATETAAPSAPAGAKSASASKDQGEVVTGSRIPRKGTPEQPVKSVSGDAWRRESSTVIGNQPRGN